MVDQMIRLHWSPRSPFVRKVVIAAHEANLAARLVLVRTVVSTTAANAALLLENPLGKLPTLTLQDGSSVYDSPVIVEYFAQIAPQSGLLPLANPERLTALRQQALGDGLMDLMLQWLEERRQPARPDSQRLLTANAAKFDAIIKRLEEEVAELRRRPFDVGHISFGCALSYVVFRFGDLWWQADHPMLAALRGVF